MFDIVRYTPDKCQEWNQFVAQSKNGTFLFYRQYMDYHADRFHDHSLMIYRKSRLYALLPANGYDDVFASHQGLSYGGLVMDQHARAAEILDVFSLLNAYLVLRVSVKSSISTYLGFTISCLQKKTCLH